MSVFTETVGYYAKQGTKRYLTEDDKWTTNIGKAKLFDTAEDCLMAIKNKRTAYAVKHVVHGKLKVDPPRYETETVETKN